ncbi:MAG: hypothetical protein AAGI38_03190 [Bacteroidota bacterium]
MEKDLQVVSQIEQGKRLLQTQRYTEAASVLETASLRPFNQSTTTAIYLAGLAYFYEGDDFGAIQKFEQLLTSFPKSTYTEEARYHRSLLFLKKYDPEKRKSGLTDLGKLMVAARDVQLRSEAEAALRKSLFETLRLDFIKAYFREAPQVIKPLMAEAISYRMVQKGEREAGKLFYDDYLKAGGTNTTFLTALFQKTEAAPPKVMEPNIIRAAIFLPLFLDEPYSVPLLEEMPPKTRVSLEFYEGFKEAVKQFSITSEKKVFIELHDSRKDTLRLSLLLPQASSRLPTFLIGEVFTSMSAYISEWTEAINLCHVVPFSVNPSLIEHKQHTFLASPSVATHGSHMATYAFEKQGMRNVILWTDQRAFTNWVVQSFDSTFRALGGVTTIVTTDSIFDPEDTPESISDENTRLKDMAFDGVYIPISNEETAGQILSNMKWQNFVLPAMGTPAWAGFSIIDQELKEDFDLTFTSDAMPDKSGSSSTPFYQNYLAVYKVPPSDAVLKGYELGNYLLNLAEIHDPEKISFSQFLRLAESYKGNFFSFSFQQYQDNQNLYFFQFKDNTITQVNE